MVTDYDCWHETEEAVTVEMLIGHLNANTRLAGDTLRELMRRLPEARSCDCGQAVRSAIITRPEVIPARTREALAPIIGKYV
jgi:5'-methylthioadenosine phosphorylase